jgi:hypothetical protein
MISFRLPTKPVTSVGRLPRAEREPTTEAMLPVRPSGLRGRRTTELSVSPSVVLPMPGASRLLSVWSWERPMTPESRSRRSWLIAACQA